MDTIDGKKEKFLRLLNLHWIPSSNFRLSAQWSKLNLVNRGKDGVVIRLD